VLLAVFERSLAAAMMHRGEHILNNQARSPQAVMQAVDSMGPPARHALRLSVSCLVAYFSIRMYWLTLSGDAYPRSTCSLLQVQTCSNIRQRCAHTAASWLRLRHRPQRCGSKLQTCMRRGP
jgi:hypothetical protein